MISQTTFFIQLSYFLFISRVLTYRNSCDERVSTFMRQKIDDDRREDDDNDYDIQIKR